MSENDPKKAKAERYRTLRGPLRWIFLTGTGVAVLASIVQIFHIVVGGYVMESKMYLGVLMAALIPQVFLVIPASSRSSRERVPWYDLLAAAAFFACAVYVIVHAMDIQLRGWSVRPPVPALWLGIAWANAGPVLSPEAAEACGTPIRSAEEVAAYYSQAGRRERHRPIWWTARVSFVAGLACSMGVGFWLLR